MTRGFANHFFGSALRRDVSARDARSAHDERHAQELGEQRVPVPEADAPARRRVRVARELPVVPQLLAVVGRDDEQRLVRRDGVADVGGLLHQLGIDAQAAGGVDDDDVVHGAPRVLDRVAGHLDRVADAVAGLGGEDVHPGLTGDDRQLVDRVRPLEVRGHEQRGVALLLEPAAQLAGQRGLTGTLQTGEHDHRRRVLREGQLAGLAAEDADQLLVDDLDHLLRGIQRGGDLGALGPILDARHEGTHHRQRNVGLQEGQPNLARRGVDIGVGQPPLAA